MYSPKSFSLLTFALICLTGSAGLADVKDIRTAVDCANECIAALSGGAGCEQGLSRCDDLLWKHMTAAATNKKTAARRVGVSGTADGKPPAWLGAAPVADHVLFATGKGPDMVTAFSKAAAVISGQISVDVDSSFRISTKFVKTDKRINSRVRSTSRNRTTAEENVKTSTGGVISGIVVESTYEDVDGNVFVLVSLDLKKFESDKQRAIEQIGLAIYNAAHDVVSTIVKADRIGRTETASWESHVAYLNNIIEDDDEKNSDSWEKEYMDFRMGLAGLIGCVKPVDKSGADAELVTDETSEVGFFCLDRPWAEMTFYATPVNGLVDMRKSITTSDTGFAKIKIGKAWGKHISVNVKQNWPRKLRALETLRRRRAAETSIVVTGKLTKPTTDISLQCDCENGCDALTESLGSMAAALWGGSVLYSSKAELEMKAAVSFGSPTSIGTRVNVPGALTVEVRDKKTGTLLFKRKENTAAMDETPEAAKVRLVKNLSAIVKKMK